MKYLEVRNPQDINAAFEKGYNEKSIELLLSIYEPEATLVRQDGTIARGLEEIQAELEAFMRLGGTVRSINQYAIQHEDIALVRANYQVTTRDQDGKEVVITGSSAEVVRQQPDGRWLYIADHPTGANPH